MATSCNASIYNNVNHPKMYLGKTTDEIIQIMGNPFASYEFNQDEIFLYETENILTIGFRNGLVVRCNDQTETRRSIRVTPAEAISVMVNDQKNQLFLLKDISVAGAAILHQDDSFSAIGTRMNVSFALPIEGVSRFLNIPCLVYDRRNNGKEQVSIVLFDFTSTPWKKRLLARYVTLRTVQMQLGLQTLYN